MSFLLTQKIIFGLVGGLGMFLFGMKLMSEGLQKIAGDRMRHILTSLTSNRVIAALVGVGLTALIHSSSATTVMVVGFVNAGLLSLMQSIGVILGVNIGTTVTAQIIAFNITKYALPIIGIGAILRLFSKNRKHNYVGEVILGLGLLFFGLIILREAFDPLRYSEDFRQMFLLVGDYKLFGVLVGAALTVLTQGSAATLAITLALASSGLITLDAGVALILGENIGTTVTANISAIGAGVAAKRAAFSHFLFNFIGVAYMLILFPVFTKFIMFITPGEADFVVQTQAQAELYTAVIGEKPHIARHIANAHTVFNVFNALIFLPFIGVLAKVSTYFIRGSEKSRIDEGELVKFIDDRVLNTPPVAIGQARRETKRMAQIALEMLKETNQFLDKNDVRRIHELERKEEVVDLLQKEILGFLTKLSQRSISADTSTTITTLMHIVSDVERVGDYCINLCRLNTRKINENIKFSYTGVNEVSSIANTASEFLEYVVDAFDKEEHAIFDRSLEYENVIDGLEETLRMNHIQRLNTGECAVQPGLVFIDMLQCYEKIGDHTFKMARALSDRQRNETGNH